MGQLSCVVCSATLRGVKAIPVSVEVVITSGISSFSIVGMPDVAIQESRERVRAAIKASGFSMPSDKIVVNLAPGSRVRFRFANCFGNSCRHEANLIYPYRKYACYRGAITCGAGTGNRRAFSFSVLREGFRFKAFVRNSRRVGGFVF